VQQIQAMQQNLTNQWYQMPITQGYDINNPALQAQVQANVNQTLSGQGVNVALFQQWQQQMAA
jgi:hypothetical protein